jgi:hypothetical protein
MLARASLNCDAVFTQYLGSVSKVLRGAVSIADMMQSPSRSSWVVHEGKLVDERAHAEPRAELVRSTPQENPLAQAKAKLLLHELSIRGYVGGHEVEVVKPPHR